MITRYQRIAFLVLLTLSALMAAWLIRVHRRNVDRLSALSSGGAVSAIEAPSSSDTESVTLLLADDGDGSIHGLDFQVALPNDPGNRMRAVLERLFTEYTLPSSHHPLQPEGPFITDVFLLNLPLTAPYAPGEPAMAGTLPSMSTLDNTPNLTRISGQLAVINLRQSFADTHPSGIQVETLTLLSMIGTIHANFPQVTQIRFLVDGKTKSTLAGHVALDSFFPSVDTTIQPPATTNE